MIKNAIVTKFLPASTTKPARILAKNCDGLRVTISYPDDIPSIEGRHLAGALALCAKMKWKDSDTLVCGYLATGSYVFVFNDEDVILLPDAEKALALINDDETLLRWARYTIEYNPRAEQAKDFIDKLESNGVDWARAFNPQAIAMALAKLAKIDQD